MSHLFQTNAGGNAGTGKWYAAEVFNARTCASRWYVARDLGNGNREQMLNSKRRVKWFRSEAAAFTAAGYMNNATGSQP